MEYAVVTGASSGIGADLARELSSRGFGLILVARRKDRLKALAAELSTPSEVFVADLSKPEECKRLDIFLKNFDIRIFVNNAGFGDCGAFVSSDLQKELQMVQVNITALHILSKMALGLLQSKACDEQGAPNQKQSRNRCFLLNVGSSAGLLPAGPYMATYYATKAYVVSLSQAIAVELKEAKSNVSVSVLCPGPVNTEFNDVANVNFSLPGISSKACARYALRQMFKGQTVIVPGMLMKMAGIFSRLLPRELCARITGRQQKKKLGK
ncbi:MAG: SDR family oxidoreductase [Fibrobacter sp.]|nr:SDR family oxidoreductase [Fibrobacter sp.]